MKKLFALVALLFTFASPAVAEYTIFYNYGTGAVTTAAYTTLSASIPYATNQLQIFDSSGQVMILALGAPASEVDTWEITPGGQDIANVNMPGAKRLSIKAKTATASSGLLIINFVKKI